MTAAILGDAPALEQKLTGFGQRGTDVIEELVLAGLALEHSVTILRPERLDVLGQILYHVADQLPQLGLFYDAEPTVMSNRLVNVGARWPSATQAWNAQEWDFR